MTDFEKTWNKTYITEEILETRQSGKPQSELTGEMMANVAIYIKIGISQFEVYNN
jgi:hypothetical protein